MGYPGEGRTRNHVPGVGHWCGFPSPTGCWSPSGGTQSIREGISGTVAQQRRFAENAGRSLLPLMRLGRELVITHGNGPVVGKILMRQDVTGSRRCRSISASRTARAASPTF